MSNDAMFGFSPAGETVVKTVGSKSFVYLLSDNTKPADGSTVVIGANTYEFNADAGGSPAEGNIDVDTQGTADAAACVAALQTAINANEDEITAEDGESDNELRLVYDKVGTNSVAVTCSTDPDSHIDASASTFTGGAEPAIQKKSVVTYTATAADATRDVITLSTALTTVQSANVYVVSDAGDVKIPSDLEVTFSGGDVVLTEETSTPAFTFAADDEIVVEAIGV